MLVYAHVVSVSEPWKAAGIIVAGAVVASAGAIGPYGVIEIAVGIIFVAVGTFQLVLPRRAKALYDRMNNRSQRNVFLPWFALLPPDSLQSVSVVMIVFGVAAIWVGTGH